MAVLKRMFFLLCETDINAAAEAVREAKPDMVVVDSVQTMYSEEITSAAGSVSQVREVTSVLMQLAKVEGIAVFFSRSRDKRRRSGRTKNIRAYGRYGIVF